MGNILIGGAWSDSVLITENQVAKLSSQFHLFSNKHLCLLAYNRDCSPVKCFPLDTRGPYSLMGIWESAKCLSLDVAVNRLLHATAVLHNLRQAIEMFHYRILAKL